MSSEKYRAAVIGCGRIGLSLAEDRRRPKPASHAEAYNLHPRTELVGLVEKNPLRQVVARRLFPGVPIFETSNELFATMVPDIVSIATWHNTHYSEVLRAAQARVPIVICEKPLAISICEGQEMIAACAASGSLLFVNHSRRFDPVLAGIRRDIKSGKLGKVYQVTGWYAGGIKSIGTHLVDFLIYLFGDAIECWGRRNPLTHSSSTEDFAVDAMLEFEDGVRACLQSTDISQYGIFEIRLLGERGELFIRDSGRIVEFTEVKPSPIYDRFSELSYAERTTIQTTPDGLLFHLIQNAVDCLDKTAPPISTGMDALTALCLVERLCSENYWPRK